MKKIDYARLRNYSITTLLAFEIGSMHYYLFKNGYLRKAKKSELKNTLRKSVLACPSKVSNSSMIVAVKVDFMGHARKGPIKKLNLRTCHNLTSHLWNSFIQIYESATRIDIVFDLYILNSIKNDERDRRGPIAEQILPAEMDLFWALSENKIVFQQFFIEWCVKNHSNDKPIYLGGAHPDNIRLYKDYWTVSCAASFKCDHEKADDRMMFHCQPCYQSWKL